MNKFKLLNIFIAFYFLVNPANALVTPKNYDFTYDKFKEFYPGVELSSIKKNYPNLKLIKKDASLSLYEVDIVHIRYKFPLYFQIKENKVVDFYAKLPSYFIHDIFHQSLINRFGMQSKFVSNDGTAYYIWQNAEGLIITYSGACTITCFPVFIHGISNKNKELIKDSFLKKVFDRSDNSKFDY